MESLAFCALVFIQVPWLFPRTSEYIATFSKAKETIYLKSELQFWKLTLPSET